MPLYSVCLLTGQTCPLERNGTTTDWSEVTYFDSQGRHYGWVYSALIEPFDEALPILDIPHPTDTPQDAAQYMLWRGQVQYNLCGEFCAAYCAGVNIETLLTEWQAKAVTVWQRVFGSGGRARGTDVGELDSMFAVCGFPTPSQRLDRGLWDAVLNRALVTPGRMEKMLVERRAIVGVKIDAVTGSLRGGGVAHWVVLESVYPHGVNRGSVEIYNPFTNTLQGYSWQEFVNSMGSPYGIWVERK